jgi:NADH-quinone oxidoreductase subunit I
MSGYFKEIITGLKSLAIGLQITNKEFFTKPITLQYPHESVKMTPRYRGHIELVKDPQTGTHRCIACGMCEKGCPTGCITVQAEKREGVKGKVLTAYILNFTTCSLCGQCVENCKPEAINFSNEYNLASTRREDYIFNLLQKLHPEGVPEPEIDQELLKKEREKKEAAKKEPAKKAAAKEGGESKAEEKS